MPATAAAIHSVGMWKGEEIMGPPRPDGWLPPFDEERRLDQEPSVMIATRPSLRKVPQLKCVNRNSLVRWNGQVKRNLRQRRRAY